MLTGFRKLSSASEVEDYFRTDNKIIPRSIKGSEEMINRFMENIHERQTDESGEIFQVIINEKQDLTATAMDIAL